MILAIREWLRSQLSDWGYPVRVTVGDLSPARFPAAPTMARVGIDYDLTNDDEIRGPVGIRSNPNRVYARYPMYRIKIFAAETRAGALGCEHVKECYRFVDAVLVALHDWAQAGGAVLEIANGGLMSADELQGADVLNMAAYQLFFRMGRSVDRRHYDGSGHPEGLVTGTSTTTRLTLDEDSYEDVD